MPLNTAVVAVTCWIGMFVMSATLAIFFTMIADTHRLRHVAHGARM